MSPACKVSSEALSLQGRWCKCTYMWAHNNACEGTAILDTGAPRSARHASNQTLPVTWTVSWWLSVLRTTITANDSRNQLFQALMSTYLYNSTFIFLNVFPAHSVPRPLLQFRNHFSQTVGLLGRVISPSQGRCLNTGQHKHRINAYTHQTSMPWGGIRTHDPSVRM
jgi:hypothetical protein